MKVYRYQKKSDDYTTYRAQGEGLTELCSLPDGYTYISGPDELPPQPEQIAVEPVVLTNELKAQIKAASQHVQLISSRMQERIRAKYSAEDESYLTRIGVGQALGTYKMAPDEMQMLSDYQTHVEGVRQWGREQRAELGLSV